MARQSGNTTLRALANILRMLLLLFIGIVNLAVPIVLVAGRTLFDLDLPMPGRTLPAQIEVPADVELIQSIIRFGSLAFMAIIVVATCLWTYRAWANLHRLGAEGLRFQPWAAVASFFIPLANLYLPFKAMRELYNRSKGEDEYQADSTADIVTAWWACSIGTFAIQLFQAAQDWFNSDGIVFLVAPPAVELLMWFLGVLLSIGSAYFLSQIVFEVTKWQGQLAEAEPAGA